MVSGLWLGLENHLSQTTPCRRGLVCTDSALFLDSRPLLPPMTLPGSDPLPLASCRASLLTFPQTHLGAHKLEGVGVEDLYNSQLLLLF